MVKKRLLILLIVASLFVISGSAGAAAGGPSANLNATVRHTGLATRPTRVRFEGMISQITIRPEGAGEVWVVVAVYSTAGVEVTIQENTAIVPPGYRTIVGDWVQVKAIRSGEGPFVAEQVQVRIGAIGATPAEFRGPIESIEALGENTLKLVIAGSTVIKNANTQVEGELQIGYIAEVQGDLQANGIVLARRIVSMSPGAVATTVEFEGVISDIQNDWWLIALNDQSAVKVWISGAEIPRQGHVGLKAEVRGRQRGDGSVAATLILVEDINPQQEVRLSGQVVSMTQEVWVIAVGANAQTVYLDANTFIDESRAPALPGNLVSLLALQRSDDSLLALRIRLERPD